MGVSRWVCLSECILIGTFRCVCSDMCVQMGMLLEVY